MRIGHGYDAHRFCPDKPLVLGGVTIPSPEGLLAHSDGDVLLHALMDALLGAAGERDIGYQFPPSDNTYKDIDSRVLLRDVAAILERKGLTVEYADMTIIAQKPKISPYIDDIRTSVADVLDIPRERVNVKATTEEKMGFTGRGEGISAHAVCLLGE
ncbi:MAG: 2-C-methyl-D-erythritol 2,4-cyclodiphosphate synthase [Clostridia bacterium]|nr:2-C-methyl-D-erythritol 2,4-cyclodiphosphate synthase [Clostridia bacterium]MBO5258313.1 2-C-methyl-D-erythritol 2,4-cyclodiphosphate synthase [Clostridia bacterium]